MKLPCRIVPGNLSTVATAIKEFFRCKQTNAVVKHAANSMNFTLIPFFLVANITVNDPNEWIYGPEYIFHANITYLIYPDAAKQPVKKVNETLLLKCRPESENRLLCIFEGQDVEMSDEDASSEELPQQSKVDLPFLIEFSPRGIENLQFPYLMDNLDLYVFRSIVKQLSVGADLTEKANTLFGFEAKENYVLGECTTWFRVVEYDKNKKQLMRSQRQNQNYKLELLSLNRTRPDPVFVIEKKIDNKGCVKQLDAPQYTKENFDVEAVNKMHVSDDVFRSRNEVHVKSGDTKKLIFHDVTCLELLRIVPAKEPLPSMNFEHVMPLHFEGTMDLIYRRTA